MCEERMCEERLDYTAPNMPVSPTARACRKHDAMISCGEHAMITAAMITAAERLGGWITPYTCVARSRCKCPQQPNGHPLPLCAHAFVRQTQ